MELNCPQCHAANRFDAERAVRTSRFKCAGCQVVFEAMLVEGVLQPVHPQDVRAVAPFAPPASPRAAFEDVLDIFDPPESPGEEPDAAPQVFEDLLAVPPPAAHEAAPLEMSAALAPFEPFAPADEADPIHLTEPVVERAAVEAEPFPEVNEMPVEMSDELPVEMPAAAAEPPVEVAKSVESVESVEVAESVEPAATVVESVAAAPAAVGKRAAAASSASAYDKYAVGMRVLRVSPMWLLLSSVGFFAVLLTLSWMSKPVGPVGEAVAAGAKLPNSATSPATKEGKEVQAAPVSMVEAVKSEAEKALPPAPPQSAKPSAEVPKPEAAEAPKQEFGPSAGGGRFTLQVGSFNNPSEANERVSQLRAAGYAARAVAAELPGRGTWYRVQAGRFESREEAAKAAAQMRAKGAASAAMVTEVEKQ